MIRGLWSRDMVGWIIVAALLPPLAVLLLAQGEPAAWRVAVALAVIAGWQLVFRWAGGVPMSPTAALTAVAVAILAPGEIAVWQLALAVSFGSVLGELVFGGWGRNVLSPAVVTLAFIFVSFPGVRQQPAGAAMALACVPAAGLLLAMGVLSWRVLAGALAGLAATAGALGADLGETAAAGGIAFGIVFLVGDPVSSPSTAAGRWLHGLLAGALIGQLGHRYGAVGAPQATVFAALLASIFAPLLDQAVIAARAWRRRLRHG
jgi:Na+-transporting NADH:ubiquinone oxidoreductase subunit B